MRERERERDIRESTERDQKERSERADQREIKETELEIRHDNQTSPNQVLTHAARAAAKQRLQSAAAKQRPPLVAARGAREGLWLEQQSDYNLPDVAAHFHIQCGAAAAAPRAN